MLIRLLRSGGSRALFLSAAMSLDACPFDVQAWLGPVATDVAAELRGSTPGIGINWDEVIEEIQKNGYCALDDQGIVRTF